MSTLEKYRNHLTATLVALIIVGGFILYLKQPQAPPITVHDGSAAAATVEKSGTIEVYVSGAVVSPGVYEMEEGERVEDAIAAAGGPRDDADLPRINLAKRLTDELQVHVPAEGESDQPGGSSGTAAAGEEHRPININTATVEELESLPGIGLVYAERIVDYREKNGPFESLEEIKKVQGIGDSRFEQIKDLITL